MTDFDQVQEIKRKQAEMRGLLQQVQELQDQGKQYSALRPLAKAWKLDQEIKKMMKELKDV